MALVTLQTAKDRLRIRTDDRDGDIDRAIDQASDLVLKHLKGQAVAGWSDGTVAVPGNVEAATCLLVGYLISLLGDDMKNSADVWQAVERCLMASRDPALA